MGGLLGAARWSDGSWWPKAGCWIGYRLLVRVLSGADCWLGCRLLAGGRSLVGFADGGGGWSEVERFTGQGMGCRLGKQVARWGWSLVRSRLLAGLWVTDHGLDTGSDASR